MQLGQKLKEARLNAGLKQEELAKQLGVSRQTISSWENDRSYPDLGSAVQLSNLYGRSMDEMLKDDDTVITAFEDLAKKRRKFWQRMLEIGIIIQMIGFLIATLGMALPGTILALAGAGVLYLTIFMHLRVFDHNREEIFRGIVGIVIHGTLLLLTIANIPPIFSSTIRDILRLVAIFLIWSAGVWTIDWKSTRLWLIIVLYIAVFLAPFIKMAQPLEENTDVDPFSGTHIVQEVLFPENGMDTENTRVALRRIFGKEPYMTIYETDEPYPIKENQDYFHFVDPAPGTGQLGTWQMIPAEDETLTYWLTVEADNIVLLSFYCNDQLQWKWKLVEENPVLASASIQTWGQTTAATLTFYTPDDPDPQPNFRYSPSVNGKGTLKIALTHPESNTLTLIEEYHHGDTLETATYTLEPNKSGSFPLDLKTRYDGQDEWALYRIPYQDGEYRFVLTYGK